MNMDHRNRNGARNSDQDSDQDSDEDSGEHWQRASTGYGAVAAGNPHAVAAGVQVLRDGGNAFDAAVATAFAMGVVEPMDSGLGGGGFATLHDAASGATHCLDFMSAAPLGAHYSLTQVDAPDTGYRIQVQGRANEVGHRAVAVPGATAGLAGISARFGTLPFAACLAPAIALAEGGFEMAAKPVVRLTRTLAVIRQFPAARALLLREDGVIPAEGEARSNPVYAQTLRELAEEGPQSFYEGTIAQRIVADMRANDGFLCAEDLSNYRALWRAPARGRFGPRRVFSMPPPSSGYLVIRGLAALADARRSDPGGSPERHRVEAMLAMFRARARGLGDPAFSEAARRLAREAVESSETTSLSVIDRHGNAVVITFSLNNFSGVVVPGSGILLNNQMLLFEPWAGGPNSVEGGKRPASSMMPTLLLDDAGVELAIGASGSSRVPTALLQVMDRVFNHGESLRDAITSPRLHAEGERLMADAELETLAGELAGSYGLSPVLLSGRDSAMGSVQAIRRDGARLEAVGDPRSGATGRVV